MKEELEIIIGPDGDVKIITHGIKGPECMEATKFLEQALGRVVSKEPTEEYYEGKVQIRPETHLRGKD